MINIRNTTSLKVVKLPSTWQPYTSEYHETLPICYHFQEIFCTLRLFLLVARVLINPWPDKERNKLMFLSEWREISFGALPCKKKKKMMTACVSMLLKSRASLTCFRACFLPDRAKDLSAPRYFVTN